MTTSRAHTSARRARVVLVAAVLTGGCASLDPAADIDRSAALVEQRTAIAPEWSAPWDEPAPRWDGRAPLSADAAVRVALRNNRALRGEVESIVATRADFVQAHLLPNPILNFTIGFPVDGGGGTPLAASVVQQLAWLWKRPAAIDAATADLQARVLAVSDRALELVAEVRRAHADVVYAERAVALQQDNLELLEQSSALLRQLLDAGEASGLDLNRVELDRLQEIVRLTDRQTALDQARVRLLELLGRADASSSWITDDRPAAPPTRALTEPDIVRFAQTRRLDVAAAEAARAGRAARLELARRGRLPEVSVGAGYQQNFSGRQAVDASVAVTPPLFDDHAARIARAASELRRARIEADRVRERATAESRQAFAALRGQQGAVRAYERDVIDLAEANLDLARTAFDAGETDLTVLLEAQRQLNDARLALVDRRRTVSALAIELERAVGGSLAPQLEPDPVALRLGGDASSEIGP